MGARKSLLLGVVGCLATGAVAWAAAGDVCCGVAGARAEDSTRRDEAQRVLMAPPRPVKVVHCEPASVGAAAGVLVEMMTPLVLTTSTSVKTTVLVRVAGAA